MEATGGGMPAVLRSVLNAQGLDWKNDFYWLQRFRRASTAATATTATTTATAATSMPPHVLPEQSQQGGEGEDDVSSQEDMLLSAIEPRLGCGRGQAAVDEEVAAAAAAAAADSETQNENNSFRA